ncbi:acyl-CoA carboxylase subunit epsilon [Corynebacterium belfantii]|uniref:Acyl-CoA carboxylase subunit epsilon n=1 Tax=Corynebacterium belfantii TaxID=2014537 RepID=A0ABS0LDS8_9CORY|nr:acyl-CoA carboxylase subunit epsilon [Corynebacterium belfantii]OLN14926.1 acyl-CoA carboxylase subunit epsilon [Corynebacterium diphtheriae subsp. lausannense]QVI97566.1 acyl-CoA carboxylase subunit epsilon [Corynebacterium diphtheriae]MBG9243895.1 acyl-CoA carboxylase subunit epsilon [Corynebacterium belfantii]MBG9259747.1 acyl-CoA carboxylase subunit epsilon [Corynebacterium belfantii]MBG9266544.1 acyl-CoA carboxylase subunit epsilon [Corynebacterium belfantii]
MSDSVSDAQAQSTPEGAQQKPILRVVKGNPDPTQVATLTALFASMADNAARQTKQERERNLWGNVEERLQRPTTYNPTAFRNVSFF